MTDGVRPPAQIRLLQGRSSRQTWSFEKRGGVSIGSGPACRWRIEAPGVSPLHALVFFDGEELWVSDLARAGAVMLNSNPVSIWQHVPHDSVLVVGGARFQVSCESMRSVRKTRPRPPPPRMDPMATLPPTPDQRLPEPSPVSVSDLELEPKTTPVEPKTTPVEPKTTPAPERRRRSRRPFRGGRWIRAVALAVIVGGGVGVAQAVRHRLPHLAGAGAREPYAILSAVPGDAPKTEPLPVARGDEEAVSPRAAVDLFVAGRAAEAMRAYSALATRHPDEPAYAAVAKILASRATTCPEGDAGCERF